MTENKKCTKWELCLKFYLRRNEEWRSRDIASDSSEKLLQRSRRESQYLCDFWWSGGGGHAIKDTPESVLAEQCRSKQESQAPELEWLARDNLETNPVTVKPDTESHMVKLSSSVPLPWALHPGPSQ